MRTMEIYEKGDVVVVEGTRKYGLCTNNSDGGTDTVPVGQAMRATVVKSWNDYETGRRYVAEAEDGKPLYFGEFDVRVRLA